MGFARHVGIIAGIFLWLSSAQGRFTFPTDLTQPERKTTMEVLGNGTAPKFLSNTYPLGGYQGLEVSVSVESFSVKKIQEFRPRPIDGSSVFFPKITVGKGIFNNSDIFFNFTPFNQSSRLSRYGMQYRWNFYQALFFPLNVSLLFGANSANIDNKLTTRSLSTDVMAGTRFGDFSFFLSGGLLASTGKFVKSITERARAEVSSVRTVHVAAGVLYQPGRFLFGLSVDQHKETVTNLKVGLSF